MISPSLWTAPVSQYRAEQWAMAATLCREAFFLKLPFLPTPSLSWLDPDSWPLQGIYNWGWQRFSLFWQRHLSRCSLPWAERQRVAFYREETEQIHRGEWRWEAEMESRGQLGPLFLCFPGPGSMVGPEPLNQVSLTYQGGRSRFLLLARGTLEVQWWPVLSRRASCFSDQVL